MSDKKAPGLYSFVGEPERGIFDKKKTKQKERVVYEKKK